MTNEDVIGFIYVVPIYGFHLETEKWKERIIIQNTEWNTRNEATTKSNCNTKAYKNKYFLRFRLEM